MSISLEVAHPASCMDINETIMATPSTQSCSIVNTDTTKVQTDKATSTTEV